MENQAGLSPASKKNYELGDCSDLKWVDLWKNLYPSSKYLWNARNKYSQYFERMIQGLANIETEPIRCKFTDTGMSFCSRSSYFMYMEPQNKKIVIAPLRLSKLEDLGSGLAGSIRDISNVTYKYGGRYRIDYADAANEMIDESVELAKKSYLSSVDMVGGFIRP